MGLEQSIFTNDKTIAAAIFNGYDGVDGLAYEIGFVGALFSKRNIADSDELTIMDIYAKNRRAEFGLLDESETGAMGPFSLVINDPTNFQSDRAKNLEMVDDLANGRVYEGFYQVGLFKEFDGLHGWFIKNFDAMSLDDAGKTNGTFMMLDQDRLARLGCEAADVLEALVEDGYEAGLKVASEFFPIFDGGDYDEYFFANIGMLIALCHALLNVEGADPDAMFFYNPWW